MIFRIITAAILALSSLPSTVCAQKYMAPDGLKYKIVADGGKKGVVIGHQQKVPAKYGNIYYKEGKFGFGIFECWEDATCELYTPEGKLVYSPPNGEYLHCTKIASAGNKTFYLLAKSGQRVINGKDIHYNKVIDENGNTIINDPNIDVEDLLTCNGKYIFMATDRSDKGVTYIYDINGKRIIQNNGIVGTGLLYNNGYFITFYTSYPDIKFNGIYNLKGENIIPMGDGNITWSNGTFYRNGSAVNLPPKSLDCAVYPHKVVSKNASFNIQKRNGLCGVSTTSGKVLVPYSFKDITFCELPNGQSYFACMKGCNVAVYDTKGFCIIPLSHGYTEVLPVGNPYDRMFMATKGNYQAVLDARGKTILPYSLELDDIEYISNGFIVKKGDGAALYARNGACMLPFSRGYSEISPASLGDYIKVRDKDGHVGACDYKGIERVSTRYRYLECEKDLKHFIVAESDNREKRIPTWFAPVEMASVPSNNAQGTNMASSGQQSPATAQNSRIRKTFYRFVETSNGVTIPQDNQTLEVTFNSDGSFTVLNQTWRYKGKGGLFGLEQWVCGNDYANMTNDKSEIVFNKQALIGGLFWGTVSTIKYTDKKHSKEDMANYARLLNGAAGSGNSNSTSVQNNSGKQNSGTQYCRRCNGTGELIKNTYPPQYSGGNDYKKKCYKCNEWFNASLGHCHVSCGSCGGTGRLR